MQALGITVALNSLIQNLSIEKLQTEGITIMSEMLINEKWEGIAFLALYDKKSKIVLHSNPALIGKTSEEIATIVRRDTPFYHKLTLGTGEEVFVSDNLIRIGNDPYLIRVALHIYPAEILLRTTKTHLIFVGFSILLITFAGILAMVVMEKMSKMQRKMEELEKLSMLTKVLVHEIRNPLGSIKGFTQYLAKKIKDPPLKQYTDIILKESLRLERLSDELSNYALPHKINITEFDIREVFNEIILSFQNLKDITVKTHIESILVKSDRDKFKQIITNIIENAIDAVAGREEKVINVEIKKIINDKIKIEITDTGIGMDGVTLKKAKEAFFTTKSKGSGLGLAIVEKLCETLKIELKIKSKKNIGTTVCLIMPESL